VRYEVFTEVAMKITAFWDVTPFIPVDVHRRSDECGVLIFKETVSHLKSL
jgi:hypothetical protein